MMIDVLLKESWDFGVLVPGNHTILAEVCQGFGRVRADEAVQAAYDKNHRDVSLDGRSLLGPSRFVIFMVHCDDYLSSSATLDKILHCLSSLA